MKKKITYLLMVAIIAFSLAMPCYADEATTPEEVVTEDVVTTIEETPVETPAEVTEGEPEQTPEVDAETPTESANDLSAVIAVVKEKIASSATWTMVGTSLLSIITFIGVLSSKFGGLKTVIDAIKDMVEGKADKDGVKTALDGAKDELAKEFKTAYSDDFKKLTKFAEQQAENEKKLYAMLTLFMTNVKISDSAKTKILELATDVKQYSGDVYDIVEQVQEAIEADKAEAEKDTPETPTLDEILEEEYMELG